jgi:Rps23 Pro-64 3,4-dihydroxylase Tpa1-like proline 4-hydroxylase
LDSWFNIIQHDVGENRKNKTIFIHGDMISKLHDFFSSWEFHSYISKIFWQQCEREFYISQQQILKRCWNKGIICQLYEDSDWFGWHVDGYEKWISLWAFTYYLWWYNNDWKREYGGILELWIGEWWNISAYKEILPKKNRIVFIIYSDSAYHRVTPNVSSFPRISLQSTIIKK